MADFLILDNEKNNNDNNVYNENGKNNNGFSSKIQDLLYTFDKLKVKEKIQFFRLLSTMINAGLSLVKGVGVLEKQQKKGSNMKRILEKIQLELAGGKNLSECMEMFPNDFSDAEIGMVRSGEKTGQLNTTLLELAVQTERLDSINGKIKSAMIYPAFIILVVVGVIYVIMTKVVPSLLEIFGDESTLPDSTKLLITVSNFLSDYGIFVMLFFLLLYILIFFWRKTPDGAYIYDEAIFRLPIFGDMMKKIVLSKFARIFSGLIGSGVSVLESLKITADAVGNEVYKQRILLLSEDVSSGIKMWESLDGDKLFPDILVQMIQVGEETAKLQETILKVSDYYDEEVDNVISNINKLLEPIIIITLAIVVGFIAMSIIEPIMNLADTVSNT